MNGIKVAAPVIVLGMHRSGTSCLAGSLQQAGLVLGDVHTANPFNKKGNREHPELMAMHEELLQINGGSWHSPPDTVEWPEASARKCHAFCRQFEGVAHWGFKDPRALIALEGWLECFPEARMVGTIRHPAAVAQSLYQRDPRLHTFEEYLELWAVYNRRLLTAWQQYQFPIVDFDEPDDSYKESLARVLGELDLRESFLHKAKRIGIVAAFRSRHAHNKEPFFDPKLRTQAVQGTDDLPLGIADLYVTLKRLAHEQS